MYLFNYILIGTAIFGLSALTTVARTRNTAKFQKLICTLNDKTIATNFSCTTKPVNRYKTTFDAALFVSRPVHHIMIHMKIYKKSNVVYKPFLVDVNENVCDALAKKPGAAPYTRISLEIYKPYISFNHTCPYEGWVTVKDIEVDLTKLKLVIPSGEYRSNLELRFNKNSKVDVSFQTFMEIGESEFQKGK